MDLLNLSAKIILDTSEYMKGLDGAGEKARSFGSKIAGGLGTAAKVGGAAIAAVGAASTAVSAAMLSGARDAAEYGDNIDKMSQKMGMSAEAYQEWDAVMQHSGTSIESLKTSMKTMSAAAEKGNEAFEKLGISQEQVANMSKEDLFSEVITGLQNMEEGTERTYLASQLLGKGATELGALLNTSAEDTQAMKDRVHELGGVMSNEAVKAAAQFQDNLQDMQTAIAGVKRGISEEFLPGLSLMMDGFTRLITGEEGAEEALQSGLDSLISGFDNVAEKVNTLIPTVIPKITGAIIEALPVLVEAGMNIIGSIGEGILDNLDTLIDAAIDIVITVSDGIIKALPKLINGAIKLVVGLTQGIIDNLDKLLPAAVEAVVTITEALIDNIDLLIDASVKLITALAEGLIKALPVLIAKAPVIIGKLQEAILTAAVKLLAAGVEIVGKVVAGIIGAFPKLLNVGTDAINKVKEGFMKKIADAKKWGKDLIDNFIGGIKEKVGALKETVSGVAGKVKSFLGFSEPEEGPLSNFHTYAPDMMALFAKGIRDNEKVVTDQIAESFNFGDMTVAPALAGGVAMNTGYDQAAMVEALTQALSGIAVNVQIGQERIDDMVRKAIHRYNYKSGGR